MPGRWLIKRDLVTTFPHFTQEAQRGERLRFPGCQRQGSAVGKEKISTTNLFDRAEEKTTLTTWWGKRNKNHKSDTLRDKEEKRANWGNFYSARLTTRGRGLGK